MIRTYISGATAPNDFAGVAGANLPAGVQVQLITATVERQIAEYTAAGGMVFVDSGAFEAFVKGFALDFDKVHDRYDRLVSRTSRPDLLAVVAPDVIGDMTATAELQVFYLDRIARLARAGVELLVPLQRGWNTDAYVEHYNLLEATIGPFTLALACNKAAWSPADVARLVAKVQPRRVHLLGVGTKNLDAYSDAVLWHAPGCELSSDANRARVFIGQGRDITVETKRGTEEVYAEACGEFEKCYDGTELDYDLSNTAGYLEPEEAKELARLFGVCDPARMDLWAKASQEEADEAFQAEQDDDEWAFGCRLGYLIQAADPCGYYSQVLVHGHEGESIKEMLAGLAAKRRQGEMRRKAITKVMTADSKRREREYSARTDQMLLFAGVGAESEAGLLLCA